MLLTLGGWPAYTAPMATDGTGTAGAVEDRRVRTQSRGVVRSTSRDWCTPPKYAEVVHRFFPDLALDPCSNESSIIRARVRYSLPEHDGLVESWDFPSLYVNPPYGVDAERGTSISQWLARCAEAHRAHGSEVLALVPVATNTGHWKKYVWGVARGVCFLADTRLKFLVGGELSKKGAPMACSVPYWGEDYERFRQHFAPYGAVVPVSEAWGNGTVLGESPPGQ